MPEQPEPKFRPHPIHDSTLDRDRFHSDSDSDSDSDSITYAELQVTSNFTFLTGASHPEELVQQAAAIGHTAIAVTDLHTVAGIVRAHVAAKETGIDLIVGTRIIPSDKRQVTSDEQNAPSPQTSLPEEEGDRPLVIRHSSFVATPLPHSPTPALPLLLYPTTADAYGRMCTLLTRGKRRAPKGECHLTIHDVIEHQDGLVCIVVPPAVLDQSLVEIIEGLRRHFNDDRLSIAASCAYSHDDAARLARIDALSKHTGVPMVATNDVHYHAPARRALQDILTCIRHGCTIEEAGFRLAANAERYLKPPHEMARLFAKYQHAIRRTIEIAQRASGFNLDQIRYQYPHEVFPEGRSPMESLIDLTRIGAARRYPEGLPGKVRDQIDHELKLIDELNYAPYFLTVYDIVKFARSRGILCQGRGAAANSAVCYCLEITSVDPNRIKMLFERFISRARNEPPDIDVDFEHERREEVIQYIYQKYGRDRAALTAEVVSYRGRSAVREVGKALGLSLDCVNRLSKSRDWWDSGVLRDERLRELGINPHDPTIQHLIRLSAELLGFPRHLSQHVGGFVITEKPLCQLVPIENAAMEDRTVIEWDKDDIDAMGMLKMDCLGLGMLTCIRKALGMIDDLRLTIDDSKWTTNRQSTIKNRKSPLQLHTIPPEDPAVYDMLCKADAVGVFQVESRAQMAMLPRLKPRSYYDLVIEVAIVRPGPIQGKMVHPYLRRRAGEEPVEYPDDKIRGVLEKTLGVPIFQEQAMQLAIVAAGFTPDEAERLRRTMATWKRKGHELAQFGERLIAGMLNNGYSKEFAERCFEQIRGFSEYGFPESHSASFALLVYASAWIKCYYPAVFAAALINSQPMGFYAPAQIIRDAQEHGVEVRAVDVNRSAWDCTLEGKEPGVRASWHHPHIPSPAYPLISAVVRLGFRLVKGLREEDARILENLREENGAFASITNFRSRTGLGIGALKRLAEADAFNSMGLDRQHALWQIQKLRDEKLPLFDEPASTVVETQCFDAQETIESNTALPPRCSGDDDLLPRIPLFHQVGSDYRHTGLSLKAHPISFIRDDLDAQRVTRSADLKDESRFPNGSRATIAGVAICRQRPGTASGIVFITLEDETGIANLVVWPKTYEKFRRAARHGVTLLVRGRVERKHDVIHVIAHHIDTLDHHMVALNARSRDFH